MLGQDIPELAYHFLPTTSALCGENHLNGSMSGMPARWMVRLVHLRGASPGDIACLLIQLALLDIG